ncbi:MAG: LysR substrate-binding domain-containing protein [Bdellovibrionota bacterium]
MDPSWLTFRDLEYLVSVAKYGHFSRAAEACRVSQPSLSAQIKRLEERLDLRLFERTSRRVSVTEHGRAVIAQAELLLREAQKLVSIATEKSEPLSGQLRLGAIATVGPYLLPYLLGPLKKAFPKMDLLLREGLTDQLLSELRSGALDAILAAPTFDENGFHTFNLFFEPFLLTAPKGHQILNKQRILASDLKSSEMVLLEDGHCLRDQTLDFCPRNRRGNIRKFHATSIETLRHLVATGHGYTLMPALAVNNDKLLGGLITYKKFDQPRVGREIILVCRDQFSRIDEIKTLADFIRSKKPRELT